MRKVRGKYRGTSRRPHLSQKIAVNGWQEFTIILSVPARDPLKGMVFDRNDVPPGRHVLNTEAQVRREIRSLLCIERSTYYTFFYMDSSGSRREGDGKTI
jgi:hypothetical protein